VKVPHQAMHEPRSVLAFERDLRIVNQDRGHLYQSGGPMSGDHRRLDRRRQAGLDPVAGE
jgi:hypothetical protein